MPNGMNSSDASSRSAPLQQLQEFHGVLVEGVVLDRLRHAQVRLQRDVAEILQDEDAEVVRVAGDGRHGERDGRHQPRDVHERQLGKRERRVVDRQHDGRIVRPQHAEVLPRGRVAGQRHHAHVRPGELRALETPIDLVL